MLLPFFYHTVSDENLPHCKHLFSVKTVKQFEADLEFLLTNYEPLMLDELPNWKQLKKPKFLLTFDDGMREVGEIIAPILLKKGVPAIFFVNKSFAKKESIFYKHTISLLIETIKIGAPDKFQLIPEIKKATINDIDLIEKVFRKLEIDPKTLITANLYLNHEEIKSLSQKGFLIGAHSVKHPHFKDISEKHQLKEVWDSMSWVTESFRPEIKTFAFPFEDYFLKKAFFEKMEDNKYAPEITFGTSEGKTDEIPYSIQRIDAEKNGWPIEKIIKNYRRKKAIRKLIGRNIIRR